jgi:hypothetical protein
MFITVEIPFEVYKEKSSDVPFGKGSDQWNPAVEFQIKAAKCVMEIQNRGVLRGLEYFFKIIQRTRLFTEFVQPGNCRMVFKQWRELFFDDKINLCLGCLLLIARKSDVVRTTSPMELSRKIRIFIIE